MIIGYWSLLVVMRDAMVIFGFSAHVRMTMWSYVAGERDNAHLPY